MKAVAVRRQNKQFADKIALIAQVLECPDCRSPLGRDLECRLCHRSFLPEEDGIISALPKRMLAAADQQRDKNAVKTMVDNASDRDRPEAVVQFERAFHDEQASYYDELFADPQPLSEYYRRLVCHQIYHHVKMAAFVIDLCCGTGKSSIPLAERGMPVVGLDVSREMLRLYRRKCEAAGRDNVILVHADASHPPLRKTSCEAIMMIGGLHHLQERDAAVKAACEALVENGSLILHEPLQTGKTSRIAVLVENVYALIDIPRVWRALLRRIGIKTNPPPMKAQESFTPYERPFHSAAELVELLPPGMNTTLLRSQGLLGFREFPPYLQAAVGRPLGAIVVRIDAILARTLATRWCGDALLAVFRKFTDCQASAASS